MSSYRYYEIPVCYMTNGLELKLPVHEFSGGEGPVVGITASIHGDETIGVEIARRVVEALKGMEVHGKVKIMSVASPLAFEDANRNTPTSLNYNCGELIQTIIDNNFRFNLRRKPTGTPAQQYNATYQNGGDAISH